MLKLENELYVRFILLLIKGGTSILRNTIIKGLEKRKVSLDDFLRENKQQICKSAGISKLQQECLYPPAPHSSDILKWDISMLSYIALKFSSTVLSGPEKIAVRKIMEMCNVVCKHSVDASMEEQEFSKHCKELTMMFEKLSNKMPDKDKNDLTDLIAKLSGDGFDFNNAIEELKHVESRDDFSCCIQKSLEHLQTSLNDGTVEGAETHDASGLMKQLIDIITEMEDRGMSLDIENKMTATVNVCGVDGQDVDRVETFLLSASIEYIGNSESTVNPKSVRESVATFLEDIEQLDVKIDLVTRSPIMYTFACSSLGVLKDLIEYFEDPMIKTRLDTICEAFQKETGHQALLSACIHLEPLRNILEKLEKDMTDVPQQQLGKDKVERNQPNIDAGNPDYCSSKHTHEKSFGSGKEIETKQKYDEIRTGNTAVVKSLFESENENSNVCEITPKKSGMTEEEQTLERPTNDEKKDSKNVFPDTKEIGKDSKSKERTITTNKSDTEYDVDTGFGVNNTNNSKGTDPSKNMQSRQSQPKSHAENDRWEPEIEQSIMVHFHALISPDFKLEPSVDKVVVRIGDDSFGGWNNYNHEMKYVRTCKKHHIEMEYSLCVPKSRFVRGNKLLNYKYYVIRNTTNSKGNNRKNLWDHYYIKGNSGPKINRRLNIPQSLTDGSCLPDVWHQYDGVVNREPEEGVVNWIKDKWSRKNRFQDDAEISAEVFGGEMTDVLFDKKSSLHAIFETTEKMELLIRGIHSTYCIDAECYSTENECFNVLGKYLFYPMFACYEEAINAAENTQNDNQARMGLQFSLLAILKSLNCSGIDVNTAQVFCKTLLITIEPKTNECRELNFISRHIPHRRKLLKDALVDFLRTVAMNSNDPSWIFAMPLLHFLSGNCRPFERNEDASSHDKAPTWWGISEIGKDAVDIFKNVKEWAIPLENIVLILEPFFNIDYLLPRTIMSSLDLTKVFIAVCMNRVPIEICCATLVFFLKSTRPKYIYGVNLSNEEKLVCECTGVMVNILKNMETDGLAKVHWKIAANLSLVLAKEALHMDSNRNIIASNSIFVHLLCSSKNYELQKSKAARTEILDTIRGLCLIALTCLKKQYSYFYSHLEGSLFVWNSFLTPKGVLVHEIETVWNSAITTALEQKLTDFIGNYETSTETFVKLYCKQVETYNPSMQKCLHETAYQAMERCYKIDVGTFNEIERKKFGILLSRLFEAEWSKVMENVSDVQSEVFLYRLLQLPPFLHFMNVFYTKQRFDLLNDACKVNLLRAISIIDTKVDKLFNGSLAVGDLKVAHKFQVIFVEAAGLVKQGERSDKNITREMIVKALNVRMKELEAFQMDAQKMASLTFLCKRLPNIDVLAIEKELNKQAFIEKCSLNDFCKPVKIETVQNINTFMPSMTAFNLPQSVRAIIPQLSEYQRSAVFLKMWEHACEKNADSCTSLEDVVNIWKPVSISWLDKSNLIQEGTISFRDFENLIVKTCHGDDKVIASELRNMRITEHVVQTRLNQLKKYKLHKDCRTGAKILLDLKSKLGLSGNYNELEVIAADETAQLKMAHFDDSFISTYTFLEGFSTARINCIHTFLECHTLVQWLKESMHTTGLKEFQVFVELAFIAIGDDPFNIGKVQTLHSAVNGYAPLIFDLPSRCDFEDLLDLCKIVWRNLEANSKLPKQLADTESQIEWLKEIKNAHGSVEVTCMMQTDAINSDGTIIIGKHTTRKDIKLETLDIGVLKVEDTIKLTVPGVTGIRKFREYTFAQLQDLQSRLMLVAGKAEKGIENVERFTMILDSITRLSNVFIKLYGSGCVLFKEWSVRFICDPDPTRPVCVSMEFANGSEVSQLKGRRSVNEDLKDMIPKIARFMESCLKDWLHHIEEKREIYQSLNYFTVDQLVILQKELLKFGDDEHNPSHLIYPLLSTVKDDCTEDDVIEAMKQAKELLDRKEQNIHSLNNDKNDENDAKNENEQRIRFIKKLVQQGQSQLLAERASEHVDPMDYSEGMLWCMDHAEDKTDESGKTKDSKFIGWSQSAVSMQSLIDKSVSAVGQYSEIGVKYLIKDLQKLWKEFLESIKSNVKDYLSIEHLGIILEQLSSNDMGIKPRVFPVGFKEGVPNLIVCPSDDVLNTTLSIYLSQKGQPLPRADEVLMCKADTTKEEVGIFFRRVFAEKGNKIHCLLNTEWLPYNVSEAAKRQLEEHLQQAKCGSLRLFVICESDSKHRTSILVSFLHRYKRQPPIFDFDRLRSLMRLKLAVEKSEDSIVTPAGYADHERSSVRVIKSWRPGVGKTLFMNRKGQTLKILNSADVNTGIITIPLQEKEIDIHYVIERLLNRSIYPKELAARLFHIDISHEVQEGVDYLLFNMLILGRLTDRTGYVWKKSENDLHLIETMPLMIKVANEKGEKHKCAHQMLNILPDVTCRSPQECLRAYTEHKLKGQNVSDQLFDKEEFGNEVFQTPFKYLIRLEENKAFEDINPDKTEGSQESCLHILLRYCGVQDPSWAELRHFVWFLNTQLSDIRANNFMGQAAADLLPGFSKFTLKFLIQMSKDFSTRSLKISEESPGFIIQTLQPIDTKTEANPGEDNDIVQLYQMRRTWESSPHPYIFFNADRMSLTFLGFNIEKRTGNLKDHQTGRILERGMMKRDLFNALVNNNVPLQENFDILPRMEKIARLRSIMGIESNDDPDDSYELTADNVKKMMAIYMRFRCNIPVIIMGETGCGKTRLVKFLCGLQQPADKIVSNMVLMKIHGGITNTDIIRSVQKAETLATANQKKFGKHMYTVLFLDEANSTEAIGLIKELLCDKSIYGISIKHCENLKIVAACNPYRKHSEKLIKKLEQAGLGYHVDADETTDRLGRVPMRRLVYRVQPLPQSLLPLVWDFGQLNTEVEDLYIRQMVRRYVNAGSLPIIRGFQEVISDILTKSQDYMRNQKDECSFVSLRDVERTLLVMSWFYQRSQGQRTLFNLMDQKLSEQHDSTKDEDENEEEEEEEDVFPLAQPERIDDVTRSLILALGVCYHACLKTRAQYRKYIAPCFKRPCLLHEGPEQIFKEIDCCQNVFLDHVDLEKNIARNMALKENVFMMVICIELRIPLFLIGKPGSSKSLAKTIVSDAMRGNGAKTQLFREMKQAQMASFQCSPLSTPDGIVGTFRQCAQFQKDNDLNRFVSVVVLDEVGLAEDSPKMPLKTLHPLLEDGCQGEEDPEDYMKVAFIGISNWALDPAKMNRGIIVQRDVPDLEELINSARGICKTDSEGPNYIMEPLIRPLAESYLELFSIASKRMREFFGLRDFYSLIKMVFNRVEETRQIPTWFQLLHAIMRNFGGLDQVDPVEHFKQRLSKIIPVDDQPRDGDPDCSTFGLIRDCLFDINCSQSESRYLLLLTENFGALSLVQQLLQERSEDTRPITIFGSSFRSDQEYTQVCRNINKVKVCMETGNTVVLLNLENLYESLYDALNQYYVSFGDVRYVDLGLGTHRVKCPVHPDFRLIVVAEKQTVYEKFPIPLINRLEKHFLTISTMLSVENRNLVDRLKQWMEDFAIQRQQSHNDKSKTIRVQIGDVFIGYHEDTCSAVIVHLRQKLAGVDEESVLKIFEDAKLMLLWCTTPDAVARLEHSVLPEEEKEKLIQNYYENQAHDSILEYLEYMLPSNRTESLLSQITTYSKLLSTSHIDCLSKASGLSRERILFLETLSSFDTEQQFTNKIRLFIQSTEECSKLIVIQCDSGDINANLIACARYCVMGEYERARKDLIKPVHFIFIVQLPKIAGGCFTGFQCGNWHSAHIDDLIPEDMNLPAFRDMHGRSVGTLFGSAIAMEDKATKGFIKSAQSGKTMHQNDYALSHTNGIDNPEENTNTLLQLDDSFCAVNDVDLTTVQIEKCEESKRSRLDVKTLVLHCVPAALAIVKDKEEQKCRETDRVDIVLRLIHQDQGDELFIKGICFHIAKLLHQKETESGLSYKVREWLVGEVANFENITKAGTFRNSCIKVLESKICPILAGIIAVCDTNENLSILGDNTCPWKQGLWIDIFNSIDTLKFKDLPFREKSQVQTEITVLSTSSDGHTFCVRMPFSWIFIQKTNEVLNIVLPTPEENDLETNDESTLPSFVSQKANSLRRILEDHALFKLFSKLPDDVTQKATEDYLWDVINTLYPSNDDTDEFRLVFEATLTTIKIIQAKSNGLSFLDIVIYIHLVVDSFLPRLRLFHSLVALWPECIGKIFNQRSEPNCDMLTGDILPIRAASLLIETFSPKKGELDEKDDRGQWIGRYHRFRTIVEKVMAMYHQHVSVCGEDTRIIVKRMKSLWSRVMVIRLFIEHVCVEETDTRITIKFCSPLWTVLGENTDMKNINSIKAIEKFLKNCNKTATFVFIGSLLKCGDCEKVLEGYPVTLPCGDILCDRCYQDLMASGQNSCAKCRSKFEGNWCPKQEYTENINSDGEKMLRDYQKRCNAFFMDAISQLSFADNPAPSKEVVDKLLSYAFYRTHAQRSHTKTLSIFDTGIDPNPVFRSFLLQLLLKTSEKDVIENLEKYLGEARDVLSDDVAEKSEMPLNLSLLIISCVEDKLMQSYKENGSNGSVCATKALETALKTIESDGITVEKLYGLASARFGLRIVAESIVKYVQHNQENGNMALLQAEKAKQLCQNTKTDWPRKYLVKYLCRFYGTDVYYTVCEDSEFEWMQIANSRSEECDRFVVCGSVYLRLRDAVMQTVHDENIDILNTSVNNINEEDVHMEPLLQLAIYREITKTHLYPPTQRKISPQMLELLANFLKDCEHCTDKELIMKLLENRLVPSSVVTRENEDLKTQGIHSLIVHFLIVIVRVPDEKHLLRPLSRLSLTPDKCADFFLPTMPQDDLEDIKNAIIASTETTKGAYKTPAYYKCPNGHPYVIGDCGQPVMKSKCQCGAEIGGENYVLVQENTKDSSKDQTMTGHILGPAENRRGQDPKPERLLTSAECVTIRLLIHMAMYIGVGSDREGIENIIHPDIDSGMVEEFLWHHIQSDIGDIHRALARSVDDVLLFMHCIINEMMVKVIEGTDLQNDVYMLSTKGGRQNWEDAFTNEYLKDIFSDVDSLLQRHNNTIVNDKRLGADPLLNLLFETETTPKTALPLQEIPMVWGYRTPVTLHHLRQRFDAEVGHGVTLKKFSVLQLFLKEVYHLRALRFIPSILRLHSVLLQKYQRKLDKAEASKITVAQLKRETIAGHETDMLLDDFAKAWDLCREALKFYVCKTDIGCATVLPEYSHYIINENTPVSMMLPTNNGAGLCSYALLDFLLRKQNDFLEKYFQETGSASSSVKVNPKEITSADLISYDEEHDLIPLVLANCQYTFMMGEGNKIDYDFKGLERQIMDRFLFSKSEIEISTVLQVELMTYRTESTNATIFEKLSTYIRQEKLNSELKTKICSEIKCLPDICQSLYNLDIAISFLKTTGGLPEQNLHDYMTKTLQMKTTISSQRAQQMCQLRHIKSLWLLLALLKSKTMIDNHQRREFTFENVQSIFDADLSIEEQEILEQYLKPLSVEKISSLIECLHEFILLKVAVKQNVDEEDYIDITHNKLKDWLLAFIFEREDHSVDAVIFEEFPADIMLKHCAHVWVVAYEMLKGKRAVLYSNN